MTLYNGLRTRYTTDRSLSPMTGREIGELFYQYVYLINKRSRREVRNIGEVIVPAVVRHDVVTIRSLGALVLQHVLKSFTGWAMAAITSCLRRSTISTIPAI